MGNIKYQLDDDQKVVKWVRRHREQLLTGAVVVLWLRQHNMRKQIHTLQVLGSEHAKLSAELAYVVQLVAEK